MPALKRFSWRETECKAMWGLQKGNVHNEIRKNKHLCWLTIEGRRSRVLILLSQHHFLWKAKTTIRNEQQMEWDVVASFVITVYIYITFVVKQTAERKLHSIIEKYKYSVSHREPNAWLCWSVTANHLLCRSRPGNHWALSQSAVGVSVSWRLGGFPPSPSPWQIPCRTKPNRTKESFIYSMRVQIFTVTKLNNSSRNQPLGKSYCVLN